MIRKQQWAQTCGSSCGNHLSLTTKFRLQDKHFKRPLLNTHADFYCSVCLVCACLYFCPLLMMSRCLDGATGLYRLIKSEHNATIIDHDAQIIFLWLLCLLTVTDSLNTLGVSCLQWSSSNLSLLIYQHRKSKHRSLYQTFLNILNNNFNICISSVSFTIVHIINFLF